LLFNAEVMGVMFSLLQPLRSSDGCRREVDTAGHNVEKELVAQENYLMLPHSLVVLSVLSR